MCQESQKDCDNHADLLSGEGDHIDENTAISTQDVFFYASCSETILQSSIVKKNSSESPSLVQYHKSISERYNIIPVTQRCAPLNGHSMEIEIPSSYMRSYHMGRTLLPICMKTLQGQLAMMLDDNYGVKDLVLMSTHSLTHMHACCHGAMTMSSCRERLSKQDVA